MGESIVFRDGRAVAVTDNTLAWFHKHTPFSAMEAEKNQGYRVGDLAAVKLCATCMQLIESGDAVGALVSTGDPENPVTVHRHSACPHPPGQYPRDPYKATEELVAMLRERKL
jgi:hypothetical protein